jgi:hypothetical protein
LWSVLVPELLPGLHHPPVRAEDVGFQKATPTGMAEFVIDNPKAVDQLVIGQAYYVDFTPVPPAQPSAAASCCDRPGRFA